MNSIPLYVFVCLLLVQFVGECIAMMPTLPLGRKHKREWTHYVVAIPGKALIVASIVEIILHTQPSEAAVIAGSFLAVGGVVARIFAG